MEKTMTDDLEVEQKDEEQVVETEETTEEVESTEETTDTGEEQTDWKAEAFKWKRIATKKTEPKPVQKAEKPQPQAGSEFDLEDVAVLVSQVQNKEDREVVKKYAKLEGKSLEDSLRDPIVQGILKQKSEERKSAEVAHTGGSKRTTVKVSEEQLAQKARTGDYTQMDPEALAEVSFKSKLKK